MRITPFDRAIAAFVVGLAMFVATLLQQDAGHWTGQDTIALVGWLGSTGAVYFSPNKQDTTL